LKTGSPRFKELVDKTEGYFSLIGLAVQGLGGKGGTTVGWLSGRDKPKERVTQ